MFRHYRLTRRDTVETCSSVIICEVTVYLLVIVQNNKTCTVHKLNICGSVHRAFAVDTDIDICRYELFLPADFVIPNGRIRPIQLPFGIFVLISSLQCTVHSAIAVQCYS